MKYLMLAMIITGSVANAKVASNSNSTIGLQPGAGVLPAGKYNKSTTIGNNGGCKNVAGHAPCGDFCCINDK